MATRYISLGDTLVERARIVGARYVPEGSPVATAESQNCIRLQLRRPDRVISINPLPDGSLEQLYQTVQDLLNDVRPPAANAAPDPAPAAEADTEAQADLPPPAEPKSENEAEDAIFEQAEAEAEALTQ